MYVMETYKMVLDTISCAAVVATGISAVVALVHYLRHWRDDEVKLAASLDHQKTDTDIRGRAAWHGIVSITNVGKVPVTVTGFELVDKSLCKAFEINGRFYREIFLDQGAVAADVNAHVRAKEPGVAIPKRIAFRCTWAKPEHPCDDVVVVDTAKACSTGQ